MAWSKQAQRAGGRNARAKHGSPLLKLTPQRRREIAIKAAHANAQRIAKLKAAGNNTLGVGDRRPMLKQHTEEYYRTRAAMIGVEYLGDR